MDNDLQFYLNQTKFIEGDRRKECFDCDFLALCNGGCKYNAFNHNKAFECNADALQHSLPDLIKLLYSIESKNENEVIYIGKGN